MVNEGSNHFNELDFHTAVGNKDVLWLVVHHFIRGVGMHNVGSVGSHEKLQVLERR